jgi:hypothetical protein
MIKVDNQPDLLEVKHLLDSLSVIVRALGLMLSAVVLPFPRTSTYLIIEEFVKLPGSVHHQIISEEDPSLGVAWLCHV